MGSLLNNVKFDGNDIQVSWSTRVANRFSNFCLTPARFLFGGRTAVFLQMKDLKKIELEPKDENRGPLKAVAKLTPRWIKGLGAVLLIVPGVIIGSIAKGAVMLASPGLRNSYTALNQRVLRNQAIFERLMKDQTPAVRVHHIGTSAIGDSAATTTSTELLTALELLKSSMESNNFEGVKSALEKLHQLSGQFGYKDRCCALPYIEFKLALAANEIIALMKLQPREDADTFIKIWLLDQGAPAQRSPVVESAEFNNTYKNFETVLAKLDYSLNNKESGEDLSALLEEFGNLIKLIPHEDLMLCFKKLPQHESKLASAAMLAVADGAFLSFSKEINSENIDS